MPHRVVLFPFCRNVFSYFLSRCYFVLVRFYFRFVEVFSTLFCEFLFCFERKKKTKI